jgi:RNA polymerase sigma-70 factor (ECF subfamily)
VGPGRRGGVGVVVSERIQLDLDAFIATEYPKVVAAVGLITGNHQDAADAVQDAIVGFLAKPPTHPVTNLAAWFTVVASNRLRDAYRSAAAQRRALDRMGAPVDSAEDVIALLDRDVLDALRQLPLHQRQVCTLHYLMDQSIETIAEGLGVSEGTVKTHLHRARKALASRLRKEDHLG